MYDDQEQIDYARVCTDYAVFAYLMDVFILPEQGGIGYAKELIKTILKEPKLRSCKVWMLKTNDAYRLYDEFGFTQLQHTEKVMERILK